MPGRISSGLVNNLRFRLDLSGNLRRRRTTHRTRGWRAVLVQARASGSTPAMARRTASELMDLEVEIDRLLMKVIAIGRLPDVEDALRSARRRLYPGMVAWD